MNTDNNYDASLENLDTQDNLVLEHSEQEIFQPDDDLLQEDNTDQFADNAEDVALDPDTDPLLDPVIPVNVTENTFSRPQWLQLYLIAAIFCNLYILFFDGHFDIGFWKNWTTQLAATGFVDYHGDYPPLWSDWLYVVSRFYIYTNLPIENSILFKYLTQLPIAVYHLLLIYLVYKIVDEHSKNETHFHTALIFTVFNPAILFNGPIWGQIDVTPLIPLIAAIMAGTSRRYQIFTMPLYMVAMLTKFQMIAFAPVFGILFFRSYKNHLIGLLLCIPIFLLAFLPNILAHNFIQAFTLPYISSANMFSATTMGAANIWLLVTGNLAPDSIILFGIDPNSKLAPLFTVRHVGMLSFSFVCLLVFLAGIRKLASKKFEQNQDVLASDIFFYALVCTTTFFTILPGMHERYLMPAAILALALFAADSKKMLYPIMLGLISFLNHTMSHGIKTYSIWPSLAWIMVAVFAYCIFEFLLGDKWFKFSKFLLGKFLSIKWISLWVWIASTICMTNSLYQQTAIHQVTLQPNQLLLTQLKPTYAVQDYGTLQVNLNVSGTPLSIGGKRYANGFGTHANSTVNFTLPPDAKTLSFIAGLDSEVDTADVTFFVWGDGKLLWQSSVIYHSEKDATTTTVELNGAKEISLQVSAMGNIGSDHADWVNPVVTFKTEN